MVKNTQGGNKSKGLARKNMGSSSDKRTLRLPTCTLEKVAVVTQLLGHGMFYVVTEDDVRLLGRIRNKFKGRSKRDNTLVKGGIILIGLRDWEAPDFKECDLLEVYDPNEIKQLQKIPSINMTAINKCIESIGCSTGTISEKCTGEDIEFSTDHAEDYTSGIPDSTISVTAHTDDLVDIDDI